MKKKITVLFCALIIAVCLCACTTSKAFTFNVSTGESVRIELDTGDKYDMSTTGGDFAVSKGGVHILDGTFATKESWDYYCEAVEQDSAAELVDKTDSSLVWRYDAGEGAEYDTLTMVSENTGVFLAGLITDEVPEDLIKEAISRLTITLGE